MAFLNEEFIKQYGSAGIWAIPAKNSALNNHPKTLMSYATKTNLME